MIKRIKLPFNSPLFLMIPGLLVIQSCKKNDQTNSDYKPIRLSKIIDWEAANLNKDSVPEYTIEYTEDKITKLVAETKGNRIILNKNGGFSIQSKDGSKTLLSKPGSTK